MYVFPRFIYKSLVQNFKQILENVKTMAKKYDFS